MKLEDICTISKGNSPILATAIHAGHNMHKYLNSITKLSDKERLREEDPFTDIFAKISDNHIIVSKSRFEIDLNRPRNKAIYKVPSDAWGLDLWREELSKEHINYALLEYDIFYKNLKEFLDNMLSKHKKVVVLDIHSYNHRRKGENAPFDDPIENPEINLGTDTIPNKEKWQDVLSVCKEILSSQNVMYRLLDVRENVKFKGGEMAKWIHKNYPDNVCCISIEFKKIFMNEWSGIPIKEYIKDIEKMMKICNNALESILKY